MDRKYKTYFRRALGRYRKGYRRWSKIDRLEAVVDGWRTRRILKLKDIETRIMMIKDHDIVGLND
jgi:hypothetical protein